MTLEVVPLTLRAANEYVATTHRHHTPTVGCKFAIGCQVDDEIVGVAIAGRPVARMADDGRTLEVLRVATNGTHNACSFLYGAVRRVAKAMGYQRVITYTLAEEPGSSLRASGFTEIGISSGGTWASKGRPRNDPNPTGPKRRWECAA